MMFAIINRKTNKFVYGTDFRYHSHHQKTSFDKMLTYSNNIEAYDDFRRRQCGKDYCIVGLKPVEIACYLNIATSTGKRREYNEM